MTREKTEMILLSYKLPGTLYLACPHIRWHFVFLCEVWLWNFECPTQMMALVTYLLLAKRFVFASFREMFLSMMMSSLTSMTLLLVPFFFDRLLSSSRSS